MVFRPNTTAPTYTAKTVFFFIIRSSDAPHFSKYNSAVIPPAAVVYARIVVRNDGFREPFTGRNECKRLNDARRTHAVTFDAFKTNRRVVNPLAAYIFREYRTRAVVRVKVAADKR